MAGVELPPPVHILLAYAADGWAVEQGQLTRSGRPKPPSWAAWLQMARDRLQTPNGLNRLRDLAVSGMAAWKVDPTIIACVVPAFATANFASILAWRLGMPGDKILQTQSPTNETVDVVIAPAVEPLLMPYAGPHKPRL